MGGAKVKQRLDLRPDQPRLLILLLPPQQGRRVHVQLPGGPAEGAFLLHGLGDEGRFIAGDLFLERFVREDGTGGGTGLRPGSVRRHS